jgi:hypothetical protein
MSYDHREHIDHPSDWTSRSIGGKQGLVYRLDSRHLDAFDVILAATSDIESLEVTRGQFAAFPSISADLPVAALGGSKPQ